jgi:hypothetical protein
MAVDALQQCKMFLASDLCWMFLLPVLLFLISNAPPRTQAAGEMMLRSNNVSSRCRIAASLLLLVIVV